MNATQEDRRSRTLLTRLTRIGIEPGLSFTLSRHIAITNLLGVALAIVSLPWVALFWAYGRVALSLAALGVCAAYAAACAWNAGRHHLVARLWLIGWSNTAIFGLLAVLGPESGAAMLFTAAVCVPLVLFDPEDHRGAFLTGVITPVGVGAIAQRFVATHAPLLPVGEAVLRYVFPTLVIVATVFLVFIVSYYYNLYDHERAEREDAHRLTQARLDDALRESEQRYALAADGANDGLWEWSAATDQVFYSERWKALLGHVPDEIATRFSEWFDRVHPDDQERVMREIEDHMVGRSERLRTEHRMRRKDGSYRWMLSRGLAIRDRRGQAMRMAGWMTDVTERRLSHERLAESEELFRQLVVQAADAIYFFDLDGRILDANQRATADLGYSNHELLNMTLFDVDRALSRNELAEMASRIPPDGVITLERMHTRKDGRTLAVELRLGLFHHRGRHHLLGSARDVSVRKEIEAQLMLADRMVSVGTLAAGVAHEINNPLTSLLLNLEFIERQLQDDAQALPVERLHRALARAREGAERVGVIVRDLKTFSRGDAEVRDAVDLRRVLESTLSLAHPELKRRASLRAQLPPDLAAVRANEARLGQVFLNLVLNALQSFEREDPLHNRITIRVRSDQSHVVVEVEDNGPGIADEIQSRIFDPFFTTKPVGVGTGLGLYICRNIIEALDGTLTCESKLGSGTTFRVRLPGVSALADGTARFVPVGQVRASRPPPVLERRSRLLVVDDHHSVAQTLADVLHGHEVEIADSGESALARLDTQSFDFVLCDLDLYQAGPEGLRLHAGQAPARWVLLVSNTAEAERARPLLAKGARSIEKPVRSDALWELLGRADESRIRSREGA